MSYYITPGTTGRVDDASEPKDQVSQPDGEYYITPVMRGGFSHAPKAKDQVSQPDEEYYITPAMRGGFSHAPELKDQFRQPARQTDTSFKVGKISNAPDSDDEMPDDSQMYAIPAVYESGGPKQTAETNSAQESEHKIPDGFQMHKLPARFGSGGFSQTARIHSVSEFEAKVRKGNPVYAVVGAIGSKESEQTTDAIMEMLGQEREESENEPYLIHIDIGTVPEILVKLGIESENTTFPVTMVFENGKEVGRHFGPMTDAEKMRAIFIPLGGGGKLE